VSEGTCPYCERACRLSEDAPGYCRTYLWRDGRAVERWPHRYSSLHVNHIENVPFYHYRPGSRTLVLGTAGCNLDCEYCSNAHVARADPGPQLVYHLPPAEIIRLAQQYGCHNIAFAVNEPTVALPSLLELAALAEPAGFPVGVLTNGYIPAAMAEEMARAFRFVNVSLKGITPGFYREHAGVPTPEPVLRSIEILAARTHLEVSTPIIQGINDGDIPAMAAFLASVRPEIAWHVFRLLPEYRMAERERPSVDEVSAALEAQRGRLPYIYFSNFVGSRWVSTLCPACGSTAIERISLGNCGSRLVAQQLEGTRCAACDAPLPITGGYTDWHSRDGA